MKHRSFVWITVVVLMGYGLVTFLPKSIGRSASAGNDQFSTQAVNLATIGDTDFTVFLPIILKHDACTYYVDPKGSDSNPGTFSSPWKSIQHAVDTALAGSTVCIRAGTYAGFTLSRPNLTITGYPGETINVTGNGSDINTIKVQNTSGVVISNLTVKDNLLQYGTAVNVEDSSGITISGNSLTDNQGFGVVVKNGTNVIVEDNDVSHNGNGIEVRYGSAGVILRNNRIFLNDRVVDSGRGGVGITFYRTTGPVTAADNLVWGNHTPPPDQEGVGFEVYAASNVTMTGNVIWDNQTVLETGTDGAACNNLTFTRNIAYRINWQQGLILRCASNSLIAHNTFDGLDSYVFDLSHYHGQYGASIDGLVIVNNVAINGRVFALDTFPLPASVVIDYNLVYNPPGSPAKYGNYLAYVEGLGNTALLSEFQTWTGYQAHGIEQDPLLVNPFGRDYHLRPNSPAIDRGIILAEPYYGAAPDLGRYEYWP